MSDVPITGLPFTNSDEVMDSLTKTVGRLCAQVTNYKVVEADDTLPKVDGPFILVDLSSLDPLDWKSAELVDEQGRYHAVHNYQATYTLTAYRGKPHWALSRVMQSFGLQFIYDKFFPYGSPYAYSSSSSIARLRVPLNAQYFENRARVQIIFNVAFVEGDFGLFEDLEGISIDMGVAYPGGKLEVPVEVETE
ncbi:hypothetical protein [Salmonella phage SSBI34]|nr:hypothetical protein [Salmonella phage SSBI34]